MRLTSLTKEGPSSRFDVTSVNKIDCKDERDQRQREQQELLQQKQDLESQTRSEIRNLEEKLDIERTKVPAGNSEMQSEYNQMVSDLNVAYDDIITSTKEHLQMNSAIMRKEKEVKEMEARIAFLSGQSSDEEHD